MKKDITALFCFVDDFCKISEQWINKSFLTMMLLAAELRGI